MILGKKADSNPGSAGNYPPELDQLRETLRSHLPKKEWPAVDRLHRGLIQITKGQVMSLDMEMFRFSILTTSGAGKLRLREFRSDLARFQEELSKRLRSDFLEETVDCLERSGLARVRIKWVPVVIISLVTLALGVFIGRQTAPAAEFQFMMRQIDLDAFVFRAIPKPKGASPTLLKIPRAPIVQAPATPPEQEDLGLESLQLDQRLKPLQQRSR